MRAVDVKVLAVGILLCVSGCPETDPLEMHRDSGTNPGLDSGGMVTNDSGASSDAGMSNSDSGASNVIAVSKGSWTVYPNPYGDAAVDGGENPTMGIQGSAMAVRASDGGMTVSLNASSLPGMRSFGSHLHKLPCDMMAAGGHFQHMPPPPDASATDPLYGNPINEVWLDFTTNEAGVGMSSATVGWVPNDGGANAIIVHDRLTGDGGVAGPKLACLPIPF